MHLRNKNKNNKIKIDLIIEKKERNKNIPSLLL